jgi:predicted RNase H-like HicB family nuclease
MTTVLVILEHGPTGSWGAYCPDVPGCVAVGNTREEVTRLMQEALAAHLESMQRDKLPLPEMQSIAEYVSIPALQESKRRAHEDSQSDPRVSTLAC